MIRKNIILWVVLLVTAQAFGQGSLERSAYHNVIRGKWDKAYHQLTKSKSKHALNVATSYVLAEYFFAPRNPDFHLDSAYHYTINALTGFRQSSEKEQERLQRNFADTLTLISLRERIDSAAFNRARERNSEAGYIDFLERFTMAHQQDSAILLRNEAAYQYAIEVNTYQAFDEFMAKYPQSSRMGDARKKYEALLFQASTSDNHLASYERYLNMNPVSPFRGEAERAIFEIRTASGTVNDYCTFLEMYGESRYSKQARDILFHLATEDQRESQLSEYFNTDSLHAVMPLTHGYLVPILRNGLFGFMNQQGDEVIQTQATEIDDDYQCGDITHDVIILPDKLMTSGGTEILACEAESIEEIGSGFILVEERSCTRVYHKSGFNVGGACVSAAKVLAGRLLALEKNSTWSIWTLTGRMIVGYSLEEVKAIGDVIIFKENNQYALVTLQQLAGLADQQAPRFLTGVEEVKAWPNGLLWILKDSLEGVLNNGLDTFIALKKQKLTQVYNGAIAVESTGTQIINHQGRESVVFQQMVTKEPWTATKSENRWKLFDAATMEFQSPAYDTISFAGPIAVGALPDSVHIHFTPTKRMDVPKPVEISFVRGQDSSSFLLIERERKKTLYAHNGKRIFDVPYDQIQYAGEGYFVVTKRERKGLITASGKPLLPLEYDAIGTVKNGVVSLLKGTRFGSFDCRRKKLIKPIYAHNLTRYNSGLNVVYKDGLYGFVNWDSKPVSPIEFDEVKFWNDTAAFVRKKTDWMIYELKTRKVLLDKIKGYTLVRDQHNDRLAIVQQERSYGVIHNTKGTVIPISFSDIINVGSSEEPLYFTEKHVEEASIFVVIYYDGAGKMLRKEVYENDDYEKIYCSNN